MLIVTLAVALCGAAQFDTFEAPGFDSPVAGVWYEPGEASSAMPLGGLGTGFLDITSSGTFGAGTMENTWLHPAPVSPKCGFRVKIGDKEVGLFPESPSIPSELRFWGHYPAADLDFGETFGNVRAYLRAYSPLVPHDYELSNAPAALFRMRLKNNGDTPAPASVALQWQVQVPEALKAEGNVEGALGWRRKALAAGSSWTISPTFVFAESREALEVRARQAGTIGGLLEGEEVPEGQAYGTGGLSGFLLGPWGGFNWETHRRESAVFGESPNLGQLFWNLHYDDHEAGRARDGAYGLAGAALPARTEDEALEIALEVVKAGIDGVALSFTIKNVSNREIRDLEFGLAANVDVGGPEHAEKQAAGFDQELGAIVFESPGVGHVVALTGQATDCIVDRWPAAHEAMRKGDWTPLDQPLPAPLLKAIPDGMLVDVGEGTYAVASRGGKGWAFQSVHDDKDTIWTQGEKVLAPGEEAEAVFMLAWCFPYWTSSDGEDVRNRYGKTYEDAGAVVEAILGRAKEVDEKIAAWQEKVYAADVPGMLKDAVINSLYVQARNSWWLADGRFLQSESFTGCAITETFVCRFNGSFPLALMWPECERATMRAVATAQAESGEIPFAFGRPAATRSPYFHVQHPIVSSEFILTVWRNFTLWGDEAHLGTMYPHVQKALRFAMSLDKDGDGLIDEDPGSETGFPANQYYDIWPWWGVSAYTGSIWLAALRAGEEMAQRQGDEALADELRAWFEKGSKSFDDKLWTGAYYRLYNDVARGRISETSLTNALCGQWFAYTCGLGNIVPKEHTASTIESVLKMNVPATKFGAVNGVGPDGKPDETFANHSAVITIGEVWNFCAMAAFAGEVDEAVALFETSYANILLNQCTPWNIPWCLDRDTGAIRWGVNYYSNPCVWTLFQALDGEAYDALGDAAEPFEEATKPDFWVTGGRPSGCRQDAGGTAGKDAGATITLAGGGHSRRKSS